MAQSRLYAPHGKIKRSKKDKKSFLRTPSHRPQTSTPRRRGLGCQFHFHRVKFSPFVIALLQFMAISPFATPPIRDLSFFSDRNTFDRSTTQPTFYLPPTWLTVPFSKTCLEYLEPHLLHSAKTLDFIRSAKTARLAITDIPNPNSFCMAFWGSNQLSHQYLGDRLDSFLLSYQTFFNAFFGFQNRRFLIRQPLSRSRNSSKYLHYLIYPHLLDLALPYVSLKSNLNHKQWRTQTLLHFSLR